MTKTLKDYFKRFEDKIVGIEETPEVTDEEFREITYDLQFETDEIGFISDSERFVAERAFRYRIFKYFRLIERFIKAQHLENQRDLWNTIIDLLNASKAFNTKKKEEIRGELLEDCFAELEKLNNTILQLQTQKTTTVEGNASKFEESKKKGTGKKGTGKVKPFNWQGEQAQLVFLIEQLIEHKFLSPISQREKNRLTAQHFTIKGKSLNPRTLAQTSQNSLNTVKPSVKPFNWQGEQAQLVYLIEQLYEQGFLSPIIQPDKHRLTAQHFTVKGESLNRKNLARARDNSLKTKKGKPKGFEKIEQIVSDVKKQNP